MNDSNRMVCPSLSSFTFIQHVIDVYIYIYIY